ncbi:hypothetical protein [Ruminococcus sp.]|uniref:hypothetical protein n=1 Tax=Ruminococcus sp. TaxID=41978 RepID=UPI0025F4E3A3|nr:hypothetical protein [Ruminococcus sp.]MBQ6250183.1 hypothetical protein [Ruminococcus sp.]
MNRDWFMNYAEYAVRAIDIETHWYELRGWITKNGRHILIGDDDGGSSGGAGKSIDKSAKSGIIKESSEQKSITEITNKAIASVPKVLISGYTDEQCSKIQNQHKELLKYARDKNDCKEVAFVFDSSLQVRKEFKGSDDRLDFGQNFYNSDLVIMHNHPRNSSYSFTDIIEFVGNDRIKTLTIVKNNGSVETLSKLKDFDKLSLLRTLQKAENKVLKATKKGEYRDSEYRKEVNKFLDKQQKGGLFEWKK